MKGLDLAERYFESIGLPLIRRDFPFLADRVAAGLAGPGSECYGFDDELSRDHDWGPGFCLWLTNDDFVRHGQALGEAYGRLPGEFEGFSRLNVLPGEEHRVGVMSMVAFYRRYTGLDRGPERLEEWDGLPEENLSLCTNGRVFYDPLGEFTAWRAGLLSFYPEDVRLRKIAARCLSAGQSGQYNFQRSTRRNERFPAQYAIMKFCTDIIALVFLLNRQFCPFYKWMHRAVRYLPLLGPEVFARVGLLSGEMADAAKSRVVEELSGLVIRELKRQSLTGSASDFLADHGPEIHNRIMDRKLRERFVFRP